jgi:CheY-like chemotaxis protein
MSARILIIDDEYDILQALRGILEDEGYDVVACSSARDALGRIHEIRPDLCLVDVMMPYMSGFDVVTSLGGIPEVARVPVILMSAVRPSPEKLADGRVRTFLQKPFDLEDLLDKVGQLAPASPDA